ncbi:MAG: hypothetical protein J6R89_04700 [Clostridia bacterium]|nr:hypothetical protein [Clostridia bacterium]
MQIAFLGGDGRMTLCAERAREEGHTVYAAAGGAEALSSEALRRVGEASLLVLPYPATRDGVHIGGTRLPFSLLPLREGATVAGGDIPPDWHRENVLFHDVAKDEAFLWRNARLTAEGALATALTATGKGLFGVSCALLGYGRIAAQLARLLLALGARVTVYARRASARGAAEPTGCQVAELRFPVTLSEGVVFNTLPPGTAPLFSVAKGGLCYDLGGSLPPTLPDGEGGEIGVISLRGVPGSFAPAAAAEVYYRALSPCLACAAAADTQCFPEETVVPTFAEGR